DSEVPLLHRRSLCVFLERVERAIGRKRGIAVQHERERISIGLTCIRICQTAWNAQQVDLAAPWWRLRRDPKLQRGNLLKEDSIAGPKHRRATLRRIPNESDARRKMIPTLVDAGAAVRAVQGVTG